MTGREESTAAKLASIALLAMDVDGVLTDGTLLYEDGGRELKAFHVADGLGIVLLLQAGIAIAWISGRESAMVERRAAELKVTYVLQGVRNKGQALSELSLKLDLSRDHVAYIADDWNDLPAFDAAGVRFAVADAPVELQETADYITRRPGGGAVRSVKSATPFSPPAGSEPLLFTATWSASVDRNGSNRLSSSSVAATRLNFQGRNIVNELRTPSPTRLSAYHQTT